MENQGAPIRPHSVAQREAPPSGQCRFDPHDPLRKTRANRYHREPNDEG